MLRSMPGYIDVHGQRFEIEYEVGGAVLLYRYAKKAGQRHHLATLSPAGGEFTYTVHDPDPGDPDAVMLASAIAVKKGYTIHSEK